MCFFPFDFLLSRGKVNNRSSPFFPAMTGGVLNFPKPSPPPDPHAFVQCWIVIDNDVLRAM